MDIINSLDARVRRYRLPSVGSSNPNWGTLMLHLIFRSQLAQFAQSTSHVQKEGLKHSAMHK